MTLMTIRNAAAILLLLAATTACNGIFDGIYDDPNDGDATAGGGVSGSLSTTGYGFIAYDGDTRRGQLYIDATAYDTWTYLNFHTLSTDTFLIDLSLDEPLAEEPVDWDLALHRWDVRTNGGAALETTCTSLDALEAAGSVPSGDYVEDTWYEYVSVDMTGVITGNIGYLSCYVNLELSKWMAVSTGYGPPSYTASGRVYMVRLSDGTYLALILSNYMNTSGTKGYLTIDYIYPFG